MNDATFEGFIARLEKSFKPLSKETKERDGMIEEYYERLGETDVDIFSKAIVLMQEHREYRSFPLIAEILSAISEVQGSMEKPYSISRGCIECSGTGYVIKDRTDPIGIRMSYNHAIPCSCIEGRKRAYAWKLRDKGKAKTKKERAFRDAIKEATEELPFEKDPF